MQVFGFENENTGKEYEGLDVIRLVGDREPHFPARINRENKDQLPEDVPVSLRKAIKAFILTCAIRRLRGHDKKHNSMLVHIALRIAWIDRIAWHVNEIIRDYTRQIKSTQGSLLDELKDLFENDFYSTTNEVLENLSYNDPKIKHHTWDEVKAELLQAVTRIEVRAVHGTKNTRVLEYHNIEEIDYNAYDDGFSVIAVGGNKLARGITLEGLSISYYLRTARMYDSLMQMGRWFGYRPGYVDLCRLYTSEQLVNWYRHITMATEEMRADFDEMAVNNLRPEDYQLKVRTHPGMLSITSIAKMREHEKIQLSFSGETKQTFEFDNNQESVDWNFNLLESILKRLKNSKIERSYVLWENIESEIILNFLDSYKLKSNRIRIDVIRDYIKKQNRNGEFKHWSVALRLSSSGIIKSKNHHLDGSPTLCKTFELADDSVTDAGIAFRNLKEGFTELVTQGKSNAILDKASRIVDLEATIKTSEKDLKALRKEKGNPLLILMPLDPRVSQKLKPDIPLLGFGIIFPELENEAKFEYAARPMLDFEEVLQEDDDEVENED